MSISTPIHLICFLPVLIYFTSNVKCKEMITSEAQAQVALDEYNRQAEKVYHALQLAKYRYHTDISKATKEEKFSKSLDKFTLMVNAEKNFSKYDTTNFPASMKREIKMIRNVGPSRQLSATKIKRLGNIKAQLLETYNTAEVCITINGKEVCLAKDPGLETLFENSTDPDILSAAWAGFRDATGKKMKKDYAEMVELINEDIKKSPGDYNDFSEYWKSFYEMENFEDEVKRLLDQVMPLYKQLHAWVRRRLREQIYPKLKFPKTGHIPAHILGTNRAMTWTNLDKYMLPYTKQPVPLSAKMKSQGFTPQKMFKVADDFIASMGLLRVPETFWNESMLEKPKDRKVSCHSSAWDMYDQHDYRITMCTNVDYEHLYSIHIEMGYLQYFMQYKDQPVAFRRGANPGFPGALGRVFALSLLSSHHLKAIGLIDEVKDDKEIKINVLMKGALGDLPPLPYGFILDKWRWGVYRGDTPPEKYNKAWWDFRCKYSGLTPPMKRTADDFDAGATYHVAANLDYIKYFVSTIVKFQMLKAVCRAGGDETLNRCNLYNNTQAGVLLGDVLKAGATKPWQDAIEKLTGQRSLSAKPLLEYYQPLYDFLKKENGDDVGWKDDCYDSLGNASYPDGVVIVLLNVLILIRYVI